MTKHTTPDPDPDRLIVIRTFSNKFEADVAKSALDAAKIDSIVRADDMGGMRPHMWSSTGVVRQRCGDRADTLPTLSRACTSTQYSRPGATCRHTGRGCRTGHGLRRPHRRRQSRFR